MKQQIFNSGVGEILFMAAARPLTSKQNPDKAPQYSIKLKLSADDPAVKHLSEVADVKIDTKTNRSLADQSVKIVNFSTGFAPTVIDTEGNTLSAESIPFFDGRTDTGKAAVTYVIKEDAKVSGKYYVYLTGIALKELNLAPREDTGETSIDVTLETLKNIGS